MSYNEEACRFESTEKFIDRLSNSVALLKNALNAYKIKDWENFLKFYSDFHNQLERALETESKLAFTHLLFAEVLFGKFVKRLDLPSDVLQKLKSNKLVWDLSEDTKRVRNALYNAYASLIDEIIDFLQYELPYNRKTISWNTIVGALTRIMPHDPRSWKNKFIIRKMLNDELAFVGEKRKEGADKEYLNKQRKELINYLLNGIALDPNDDFMLRQLEKLYFEDGNYGEAIKYYKLLQKTGSIDYSSYETAAEAYKKIGNFIEAVKTMEEALRKYKFRFNGWIKLIDLYAEAGVEDKIRETLQTLQILEKDLKNEPKPPLTRLTNCHHVLAYCYEKLGEFENALKQIEVMEELYIKQLQSYDAKQREENYATVSFILERLERLRKRRDEILRNLPGLRG